MKVLIYSICFLLFVHIHTGIVAQGTHDIGRNFTVKGFVEGIDYNENVLFLSFPDKDNNRITSEVVKLYKSVFLNKKKDSIKITDIKSNDEIELQGLHFTEDKYTEATIVTLFDKKVEAIKKGKIDSIQGEICYVDGNKIKLATGKKIKGKKGSEYANRIFNSVSELKPNDYANVDGEYDITGYYLADEFSVYPYDVTEYDKIADTIDRFFYDKFSPVWNDKIKRAHYYGQDIAGIGKVVNDDRLQEYVQQIGLKLIPDKIKTKKKFVFVVVENADFNANMRANGLCYVYTGLLKQLDNEAQLAAVLGHEIAHVIYEHVSAQIKDSRKNDDTKSLIRDAGTVGKKNMPNNALKAKDKEAATAEDDMLLTTIDGISVLINTGIDRQLVKYNINQESQADRVGLSLMVLAGYDPRQAPVMWKNIYNDYGNLSTAGINKKLGNHLREEAVKPSSTEKGKSPRKKTDKEKGGAFVNLLIKWKIADSHQKNYKTHPENLTRYAELNRLVALYYNDENFLQQSVTGEENYLAITKSYKKK